MRGIILLGALALMACNPPTRDGAGGFETISASVIDTPRCVFTPADGSEGIAFATYRDNPDFMAVVRYKGETLKLVPREAPVFDGETFDITYEVIDYLKWQVRAVSEDGVGAIRLVRDGVETGTTLDMVGSCDG
ncbi:MAG: hypothetical protein WBF53_07780 [Litorimonas sp.]